MAPRHAVDERIGRDIGQGTGVGAHLASLADPTAGADRRMETEEHVRTDVGKAAERGIGRQHAVVADRRIVGNRCMVIDEDAATERGGVTDDSMGADDRSLPQHRRRHDDGGRVDEREETPPAGEKHLGQSAADPGDTDAEKKAVAGKRLIGIGITDHAPVGTATRWIGVEKAGQPIPCRRPGITHPAAHLAAEPTGPDDEDAATLDTTTTEPASAAGRARGWARNWRTHSRTRTIAPPRFTVSMASMSASDIVARIPSAATAALATQ